MVTVMNGRFVSLGLEEVQLGVSPDSAGPGAGPFSSILRQDYWENLLLSALPHLHCRQSLGGRLEGSGLGEVLHFLQK